MSIDIETINKINSEINSFNIIDEIELDGMSVRIGGHIFEMKKINETHSIEDSIRKEYQDKFNEKIKMLGNFVNEKLTESFSVIDSLKSEYSRKEKILNDRINNATLMPSFNINHITNGVSVVPINGGGIGWIVRRVYWPKFVDNRRINTKTQKKMISNVLVYIIVNNDNKTSSVSLRKFDFSEFDHYHRNCWGDWNWSTLKADNVEDIIKIADDAIAVLERINSMSLANRTPRGLPRFDTVLRNCDDEVVN